MVIIETAKLRVHIDELGGQLHSIYDKADEIEYLWQRDETIWSSSAPVVFPVIGKLNNLECRFQDKVYSMKSNGIIRYEELEIVKQEKSYVEFLYTTDDKIMKHCYPYTCRFYIRYEVIDKSIAVTATIHNDDNKTLYYNYAGHPGFRVPLFEGESCNDYYIEFEKREILNVIDVCETGQLLDMTTQFFHNEKRFFLRKNLFKNEALVFQHPKSTCIHIKSLRHAKEIVVHFRDFDNLAIWSPYVKSEDVKFICIEPWIGHTDFKGYTGEFSQRDEVTSLGANCHHLHTYRIDIK